MPRKACTPLRVMPRTAPSEVWTVGVVAVTPADVSPPSDAHRGPPLRAAPRHAVPGLLDRVRRVEVTGGHEHPRPSPLRRTWPAGTWPAGTSPAGTSPA